MIPTRHTLLVSKLSELQEIWLQPECPGCRRRVNLPCQLLAAKHGARTSLAELLLKLKCSACGRKPAHVNAADAPVMPEHMIGEGTWVVPVLP